MPADDRRLYPWAVQGTLTPATIVSGSGSYFTDAAGNRHLDLAAQLAYMNVGHGHPHVVEAIRKQAAELAVIGPGFANRPAAAPSTSAIATARLSATIGLGAINRSWSYSCRICPKSVAAAVGASLWTALIAA